MAKIAKSKQSVGDTTLGAGEIINDDFRDLLAGNRNLLQLQLLKERGVAQAALDRFSAGLLKLVTSAVFALN